jgi:formylglycine-generating enzyme required for sulfatase activity
LLLNEMRKPIFRTLLACFAFVLFSTQVWANAIEFAGLSIASINSLGQYAEVAIDVRWDNSWEDGINHDAAWIFLKYRRVGTSTAWGHATLNLTGHTLPANGLVETSPDGKGVFLRRNSLGSGYVSFSGIRLRWNFGADGLTSLDSVDLKAFALEMVYVPQGSFFVGDGQTNYQEVYANFEDGDSGLPLEITSEDSLTLGGVAAGSLGNNQRINQFANGGGGLTFDCSNDGCLGSSGDDFNGSMEQTLPAAFPKGYNGFYCMKYELTQQQYVDMLNCLTPTQQSTYLDQTGNFYIQGTFLDNRYGITETAGVYSTATPHVPMIFMDWIKGAAFADWAALRPMTELEFEKACRGMDTPVMNAYAWGNANLDLSDDFTLLLVDQGGEGIDQGFNISGNVGNCWIRTGAQTMPNLARVGIFAAYPQNFNRVTSGATVWGIMEMSGMAWERAVSVGHPEGRKFTGLHGDGNLSPNGYADVNQWPGSFSGSTVESNVGVGYRGGGLAYPNPNLEHNARISSRRVASAYWNTVINDDGGRFVRSAN